MSVITESRPGDPIVFIEGGVMCEYGEEFEWDKAKEFEIGEVVYYLDEYEEENEGNPHTSWKVLFKTYDGKTYSANQLFLVTMSLWEQIENHFREKCFK